MNTLRYWRIARSPFHRRYPSKNRFVTTQVDKRIAVDFAHRYLYFRIPKAANSTVTATLAEIGHSIGQTARQAKASFHRASDLTAEDVKELKQRFFLFTVVRDPFARIASAYLDKLFKASPGRKAAFSYYRRDSSLGVSFLEFCRFIDDGGLYSDPHWFPQVTFFPCGIEKLDRIGKVESLAQDLQNIVSRLQGAGSVETRNWTPHKTGATGRLKELYCSESIEIVRRCYSEDFTAFSYPDHPPWAVESESRAN